MDDADPPARVDGCAVRTAFVLGGGGVLGASQVGMLRALVDAGISADVVLGTSVGALNGVVFAADPAGGPGRLTELWGSLDGANVFTDRAWRQAARVAKHRTHLHSAQPLRTWRHDAVQARSFEELEIPFACVAANIENARDRTR